MTRFHATLLACIALAVSLSTGCGGGPDLHPVQGMVKLKGKALPGAVVVFHPVEKQPGARPLFAVTDEEGRFKLTTLKPGDGAPAGKYAVTVVWRALKRDGDEVLRNGRNLLPGRYEKPETSGLWATVNEGVNELPAFDLASR